MFFVFFIVGVSETHIRFDQQKLSCNFAIASIPENSGQVFREDENLFLVKTDPALNLWIKIILQKRHLWVLSYEEILWGSLWSRPNGWLRLLFWIVFWGCLATNIHTFETSARETFLQKHEMLVPLLLSRRKHCQLSEPLRWYRAAPETPASWGHTFWERAYMKRFWKPGGKLVHQFSPPEIATKAFQYVSLTREVTVSS